MLHTISKKLGLVLLILIVVCSSSYPLGLGYVIESFFSGESFGKGQIVDKIYLARHNKNVVDNFFGNFDRASAAVNAAEREYLVDIGPINASTSANYVYASIFNPSGSGKTMAIKHLAIRANTASSTASNYVNLTVRRITTASVGTQITATNIPKKNTSTSDTIADVRYNGPTVTLAGTVDSRIMGQPLSGAVGSQFSKRDILFGPNDEKIVLQPGEGIAVYQEAAGAMATKVRVLAEWDESDNPPAALGEFLFAFPRVEIAATVGYVYNSFFNPSSSGKTAIVKRIWFGTETCDAAAVYTNKISIRRTTAASAGTSITASNIPKKNTSSSDSVMEFRRTGATSTLVGTSEGRIASVTPCAVAGESHGWQQIDFNDSDEKLILQQGEGIALISETAGNANHLVRMIIEWQEVSTGSTPSAQGEYIWASSAVQAPVAATTTHYSLFNPVGSGVTATIKRLSIRVNATTTAPYVFGYTMRRITSASGGTTLAATDLIKKNTSSGSSAMEVRWCGQNCTSVITATYDGTKDSRLLSVMGPGAAGQMIGQKDIVFGSAEGIILQPGEGIGLYNEAITSSSSQLVKISVEWEEQASTPTAQNQYLMDIGPVTGTTSTTMNYVTFFNPANSTKTAVLKRAAVRVDTVATAVYIPMQLRRIRSTSLGTLIASSSIPKKHTGSATSTMEIRFAGATSTTVFEGTTDSKIIGIQTPGAVASSISGNTGYKEIIFNPNEQVILQPGQGLAFYHDTAASDVDFRARLLLEWEEVATSSTPTSLSEYLMTTGPITQSLVANYVYTTLFNPSGSSKKYLLKRVGVQVDRSGAATNPAYTPVSLRRITAASAGTQIATTSIQRKHFDTATSSAELRTTNVTASFSGSSDSRLLSVTTPGVVNQTFGDYETLISQGDEFVLQPGEGVALYQEQATGDANVRYRFGIEWQEVSSTTPTQTLTFSISTSTIYFGVVSPVAARYASATTTSGSNGEVEAHTFLVNTNAVNGYSVTALGGTLSSGSSTITAIGDTSTTSTVGIEQFGIRVIAAGGSGTTTSPYGGSGFAYAATATTSSQIANSAIGDNATTTFSVRYIANIAPTTPPATYTTSIVFVATANF